MTPTERLRHARRQALTAALEMHAAREANDEAVRDLAEVERRVAITKVPCRRCGAEELVWCHGPNAEFQRIGGECSERVRDAS